MKEDEKSIEKIAKEFLKLRIEKDPQNLGFNPAEIEPYSQYASAINYLIEKGYLDEKYFSREEDRTVSSIRYKFTHKGKQWVLI